MHSQGEELAAGKPGMLIQVRSPVSRGVTWLRKLAQVGVSASWTRQSSVFFLQPGGL